MTKKVKTVIELLEADGWEHKRTKGDHRIFWKEGERRPVVVSGHLNDDMPEGTWKSIKRQAKLKD
ncbi:MAG: type II toxin-antitoxin system HicA family toxin [Muribaculaceae bacterium]|nr:type II toxin-antitoxin system HicA family toxin [Muribaculaceae bacterium]